jgi:phosphoribosylamine--glycine ligase
MKQLNVNDANVLIIGGGGREHALGMQLEVDGVNNLFFAPGNGGTAEIGENIPLNLKNFDEIYEFVQKTKIDLIVVGPEDPLADGIVDYFRERNILIVGPTKAAAQIESSKIFARNLMAEAMIPQPNFIVCPDEDATRQAIFLFGSPVVLKVDGLAAGKGAFVCKSADDIEEAMNAIYKENKFGVGPILVEECLVGQEISVFALCDNLEYTVIGTAQDYKRLLDGDLGPNTGGMGSISPSPLILKKPKLLDEIKKAIITPVLEAMNKNETPFTGFLYCGLMIVDGYPQVIEFNCRLGDPETQVIMQLISGNFFYALWWAANNRLSPNLGQYNLSAAFVVKVAKGYPGKYEKNKIITFVGNEPSSCDIIHAGTKIDEQGNLVTNGGRVIGALGMGPNLDKAVKSAYLGLDTIKFEDEFYRKDIGKF